MNWGRGLGPVALRAPLGAFQRHPVALGEEEIQSPLNPLGSLRGRLRRLGAPENQIQVQAGACLDERPQVALASLPALGNGLGGLPKELGKSLIRPKALRLANSVKNSPYVQGPINLPLTFINP